MMKTLKQTSTALMLALAVLASGCAADEEMTTSTPIDGEDGELMTITVGMGSDATTRVAYNDSKVGSADNDALTWQTDDKLIVVGFDSDGYISRKEYTLVGGAGQKTGSFTGQAIAGATKYKVAYINTALKVTEVGNYSTEIGSQTQAGDGTTDHLKDNIVLLTTADVTDLSNVQLTMWFSIMKFDLRDVPAEVGTLKKLTWTTETVNGLQSTKLAFSQKEGEKVTFSSSKQKLTAYLVFNGGKMAVKQGGKFTVTLEGDKTYYAETTVTNGKSYGDGKRYTATIDGTASTMEWKEQPLVVVQTTVPAGSSYHYNGLKMQIGTWKADASDTQILLGEATIADEKASIPVDLSTYSDQPIWVCIPKVAKFFHTLTAQEVADKALTLPDKDGGSTLKTTPAAGDKKYENDWIVALYMGVNKDGATDADATPIYWATGNLIATKTSAAGSSTTAAFHIATAEETLTETSKTSIYNAPAGIAESSSDGYTACAIGAQWNKFGWGDITGLKTSKTDGDYVLNIENYTTISGDAAYDIVRAKLGGSWRLPTGDYGKELAAFANNSGLSPDGKDWMEGDIYIGRQYTFATDANSITNTLKFPAAYLRWGAKVSTDEAPQGNYWSGSYTSDSYFLKIYSGIGSTNTSFRHYGFSVRPVTE